MSSSHCDYASQVPHHRTLRYYKEQRDRRKALLYRSSDPLTTRTKADNTPYTPTQIRVRLPQPQPQPVVTVVPNTARTTSPLARTTSPLAPTRTARPPRTSFPRSKPEPDLYRKAITTRMRCSPEGQKILLMGPRLALSILSATRELERIVAQQTLDAEREDVLMAEPCVGGGVGPVLGNSWVFVPGEDWEMVDCGA